MGSIPGRVDLIMSLQRALLGEVHPQLRMASIQADPFSKVIRLRFEYDGEPSEEAQECASRAATEVIADFPEPWQLDDQHIACTTPARCVPLEHVVYWRHEGWGAA